jgi:hypothetical protein
MLAKLREPDLYRTGFLSRKIARLQFFRFVVNFGRFKLAGRQQDQLHIHLLGGVEKHSVIGKAFAIPANQRKAFQSAWMAAKHRKRRGVQVGYYFLFECIEIDVHIYTTIRTGAARWGWYTGSRWQSSTLFDAPR